MGLKKGQLQVYTGDGKGKTTASLGLALRAVGRGLKVVVVQFIKGGEEYGEHYAARQLAPLLTIHQTGRDGWIFRDNLDPEDIRLAQDALSLARQVLTSGDYDLVILDEINGQPGLGLSQLKILLN